MRAHARNDRPDEVTRVCTLLQQALGTIWRRAQSGQHAPSRGTDVAEPGRSEKAGAAPPPPSAMMWRVGLNHPPGPHVAHVLPVITFGAENGTRPGVFLWHVGKRG
ncbi:hypothetical protein EKD16_23400 [Streptomonospora litoralis]|uniref:Uncharacterized protein n=1 Tax=Streptomonospora litoralis TaxID=2498135 RepID=A0A4P6Q6M9_9ACTN|nr:hypothetical protein EKD16_23400 [Streptomonospora litoralis]